MSKIWSAKHRSDNHRKGTDHSIEPTRMWPFTRLHGKSRVETGEIDAKEIFAGLLKEMSEQFRPHSCRNIRTVVPSSDESRLGVIRQDANS